MTTAPTAGTVTRTWAAFAALGAGLVHLALGAGLTGAPRFLLLALGATELVWAVLVLARGRLVAPAAAVVIGPAAAAAWVLASLVGASPIPPLPMLAAIALGLLASAIVALRLRAPRPPVGTEPAARTIVGVATAALLVAALATPALAAAAGGDGSMGGMHPMPVSDTHGH